MNDIAYQDYITDTEERLTCGECGCVVSGGYEASVGTWLCNKCYKYFEDGNELQGPY